MIRFVMTFLMVSSISSLIGCSGNDPKTLFEAKIAGIEELLKPVFSKESGATLVKTTYNIEKTDSLVSPFTAYYNVESEMQAPDSGEKWGFVFETNFAFQDGNWVIGKQGIKTLAESPYEVLIENLSESGKLPALTSKMKHLNRIQNFLKILAPALKKAWEDQAK